MTATQKTTDLVLLVPGILSFDAFGDQISALLRGHVEAELDRPVPVIPLTLGAAPTLAQRQQKLLDAISRACARFERLESIHLIGHGIGGVDAERLLADKPISGPYWQAEPRRLRDRIASVTTIASPHYGTTLALMDAVRLLDGPNSQVSLLGALIPAAFAAGATPRGIRRQLLGRVGDHPALLRQLWAARPLLRELAPQRMEELHRKNTRAQSIRATVTSYVTCALSNLEPLDDPRDPPDPWFLYLTNHVAGAHVDTVAPEIQANVRGLNLSDAPLIASPSRTPRRRHQFDAVDNDALVNTARQVAADSQIGGIVYADHFDALGYYDRRDPLQAGRIVREGILRSGAGFGDEEFFALYRSIARVVVGAAKAPAVRQKEPPRAVLSLEAAQR